MFPFWCPLTRSIGITTLLFTAISHIGLTNERNCLWGIVNLDHGHRCLECSNRLRTSFPEQAVYFYIKEKYPDAINSYKEVFSNGMELDVYIPSIKTGIEYYGIAWHKDNTLEKEERKYEICKQN